MTGDTGSEDVSVESLVFLRNHREGFRDSDLDVDRTSTDSRGSSFLVAFPKLNNVVPRESPLFLLLSRIALSTSTEPGSYDDLTLGL
jgi:hypothetical protein